MRDRCLKESIEMWRCYAVSVDVDRCVFDQITNQVM